MNAALDWMRRQRAARPVAVGPVAATRPQPLLATDLPGREIAPGLWHHDQRRAWPCFDERLDLAALPHGEVERGQLAFFDTETTGLAGGSGTRAFMIGLATVQPDGLRLQQWTTARLGAEAGMLDAFLAALPDGAHLVSYNGKSYDRPLLSTRLRLCRRRDPLPSLPHIDLLHPSRRRWRGVLPNCRLATVEREVLGIVREHDLPGSEAPEAFRRFLRGGPAAPLRRVGEHNAQDLVSLAALLLHFVRR